MENICLCGKPGIYYFKCSKRWSCSKNVFACEFFKSKIQKTFIENYGATNPNKNKRVRQKIEQTNLERYGVMSPMQNSEVMRKSINTCLEKYGVSNAGGTEESKEKAKKTQLQNWGTEFASQSKQFRSRVKQTCLEKFGCENISQCEEIQNKKKETIGNRTEKRKKEIRDRTSKTVSERIMSGEIDFSHNTAYGYGTKVKLKGFDSIYKSSWEAHFQLQNPKYQYEKIRIPYLDKNNKNRIYVVDFVNLKTKHLIEIKAEWKLKEFNETKLEALKLYCKQNGYTFEILSNSWFSNLNESNLPKEKIEFINRRSKGS